jgi:hypothetical protein
MAIYATVDKAALAAEMASWKAANAAAAFDAAYSKYAESITWADGFCTSADGPVYNYEDATWTNAMESSMTADERFAYGMAA